MLGILKTILTGSNGGRAPTPPEMLSFENKYKDDLKEASESGKQINPERYVDNYNLLSYKSRDELSTTITQQTFFRHYDVESRQEGVYPCQLEYQLDEYSGFPNTVTIVTNFGKAVIGGFTENEHGIPLPTKISFKAHDFLSKEIDYKHPFAVKARIQMPEDIGHKKEADPFSQEPYTGGYDPEEALAEAEPYNPEDAFSESEEVGDNDFQSSSSNVTFAEREDSVSDNKSDEPSFTKMFRFYMAGQVNRIPVGEPYLREHKNTDGNVTYGPEFDYEYERSPECMYEQMTGDEIKGMWIAVTPGSSEADPRANFEETMLDFHLKCFFQCFSKSMSDLRRMNSEVRNSEHN